MASKYVEVALIYCIEVDEDVAVDEDGTQLELTDALARLEAAETLWRWIIEGDIMRPFVYTAIVQGEEAGYSRIDRGVATMDGVQVVDLEQIPDPNKSEGF